jgi:predicted RNA-binding Zn-ribbon protein involved in translation (DUF1610 family)
MMNNDETHKCPWCGKLVYIVASPKINRLLNSDYQNMKCEEER